MLGSLSKAASLADNRDRSLPLPICHFFKDTHLEMHSKSAARASSKTA